jgi:hypothetical protein
MRLLLFDQRGAGECVSEDQVSHRHRFALDDLSKVLIEDFVTKVGNDFFRVRRRVFANEIKNYRQPILAVRLEDDRRFVSESVGSLLDRL